MRHTPSHLGCNTEPTKTHRAPCYYESQDRTCLDASAYRTFFSTLQPLAHIPFLSSRSCILGQHHRRKHIPGRLYTVILDSRTCCSPSWCVIQESFQLIWVPYAIIFVLTCSCHCHSRCARLRAFNPSSHDPSRLFVRIFGRNIDTDSVRHRYRAFRAR